MKGRLPPTEESPLEEVPDVEALGEVPPSSSTRHSTAVAGCDGAELGDVVPVNAEVPVPVASVPNFVCVL